MNRGISILKDLIRQVDVGVTINESDIPPVVSIGASKAAPIIARFNESTTLHLADNSVHITPPVSPMTIEHSVHTSMDVNEELKVEVEPAVSKKRSGAAVVELSSTENDNKNILKRRQNEYKTAALEAKKNNDIQTALNYVKIIKVSNRVDEKNRISKTLILQKLSFLLKGIFQNFIENVELLQVAKLE